MEGGRERVSEGGREKERETEREREYMNTHTYTLNTTTPQTHTQAVTDPTCLYYLTLQGLTVGEAACGGQTSGLLLRRVEEGKPLQQV
jgi:hypothetical protein